MSHLIRCMMVTTVGPLSITKFWVVIGHDVHSPVGREDGDRLELGLSQKSVLLA